MGYGSDGQFCAECPEGKTCSRRGDVMCEGQCDAGVRSVCDAVLGFAKCEQGACSVGNTSGTKMKVTRGSYENPLEGDCATYFRCSVGWYKRFSPFGAVECVPCDGGGKPTLARYVTPGLSPNDPRSCLWECDTTQQRTAWMSNGSGCVFIGKLAALPVHEAGWYGSRVDKRFPTATCGGLQTTEANTTLYASGCLACPPIPLYAHAVMAGPAGRRNCEWECDAGRVWRGERCVWVPGRGYPCDDGGKALDDEGMCVSSTVPWNRQGFRKVQPLVIAEPLSGELEAAVEEEGPTITAESRAGGVGGRHTVSVAAGQWGQLGAKMVVEGALCSVTETWAGEQRYLVAAVCNQSFLVYIRVADARLTTSSAPATTSTFVPSQLSVLIGQPESPGWADGFRTQARFGVELYVTKGATNGSVWVLDRWNCLVREVVVWSQPGDYRTRVYTVHGLKDKFALVPPQPKCYGPGSLAQPRRFWELGLSERRVVLFTDDNGLWQLELESGALSVVMGEGWDLANRHFEADDLTYVRTGKADGVYALLMGFRDGTVWRVTASVEPCPDDTTSMPGGDCVVGCAWGEDGAAETSSYVNQSSRTCTRCNAAGEVRAGDCEAGEEYVPCTRTEPPRCRACSGGVAGKVYVVPGECAEDLMRYTPPCPPGHYQAGGGAEWYCNACPAEDGLATTTEWGATRVEQCRCVSGLRRRRDGVCVGEELYVYEDEKLGMGCATPGTECVLPEHASLLEGHGWGLCRWECDAGYYLSTEEEECLECTRVGGEAHRAAATRGDDNSPLSCEFAQ